MLLSSTCCCCCCCCRVSTGSDGWGGPVTCSCGFVVGLSHLVTIVIRWLSATWFLVVIGRWFRVCSSWVIEMSLQSLVWWTTCTPKILGYIHTVNVPHERVEPLHYTQTKGYSIYYAKDNKWSLYYNLTFEEGSTTQNWTKWLISVSKCLDCVHPNNQSSWC